MFKDTVTYTDYDGVERTETLYFNLNRAELFQLENRYPGGLSRKLQQIVDTMDNVQIAKYFSDIIEWSYGVKSEDGRMFVKNQEVFDKFRYSGAYDAFFTKMISDDGTFAASFINGIVPADIQIDQNQASNSKAEILNKVKVLEESRHNN